MMHKKCSREILYLALAAFLYMGSGALLAAADPQEVKVDTGLWRISLDPTFSTKAMSVTFNQPNTGTKKVGKGNQVLAVKIGIYNPTKAKIGVRRIDYYVNGAEHDVLVVDGPAPGLVLYLEPEKGVSFVNYYVVPNTVKKLEDIKLHYEGIDENYAKKKVLIPLIVKPK